MLLIISNSNYFLSPFLCNGFRCAIQIAFHFFAGVFSLVVPYHCNQLCLRFLERLPCDGFIKINNTAAKKSAWQKKWECVTPTGGISESNYEFRKYPQKYHRIECVGFWLRMCLKCRSWPFSHCCSCQKYTVDVVFCFFIFSHSLVVRIYINYYIALVVVWRTKCRR